MQRQIDKIVKQNNDKKIKLFKQTKEELKELKNDLLDEYLTNSITSKIRRYVASLKLYIIKQKDSKYIQLRPLVPKQLAPKSSQPWKQIRTRYAEGGLRGFFRSQSNEQTVDANTAMLYFCRSELSQWATEEWERIRTRYAEGGLNGVFQRTDETLNSIPSLKLSPSSFQLRQTIDIQRVFQASFEQTSCETPYTEVSILDYISKKIGSI